MILKCGTFVLTFPIAHRLSARRAVYVHRKDRCRVPPVREAAGRDVSIASAIGLPDCDDRWQALRPFPGNVAPCSHEPTARHGL